MINTIEYEKLFESEYLTALDKLIYLQISSLHSYCKWKGVKHLYYPNVIADKVATTENAVKIAIQRLTDNGLLSVKNKTVEWVLI
ncbi:TPA: hypothetical protein MYM16_003580 [Klebsiella pneumoniae]|nr:hypothetical protein [Klebsiella pneumoniae]